MMAGEAASAVDDTLQFVIHEEDADDAVTRVAFLDHPYSEQSE
jgi:hypothetical protein